jgi:type IV secretory pathway ATPase VirB11/archaellum biosynthesis ATPase
MLPLGSSVPGQVESERRHINHHYLEPVGPLLEDDDVWEITINAPDQIFAMRHGRRSKAEAGPPCRGLDEAFVGGGGGCSRDG